MILDDGPALVVELIWLCDVGIVSEVVIDVDVVWPVVIELDDGVLVDNDDIVDDIGIELDNKAVEKEITDDDICIEIDDIIMELDGITMEEVVIFEEDIEDINEVVIADEATSETDDEGTWLEVATREVEPFVACLLTMTPVKKCYILEQLEDNFEYSFSRNSRTRILVYLSECIKMRDNRLHSDFSFNIERKL